MKEKLFGPAAEVTSKFWIGISKIIGALILFLIGWLVARLIKILVTKFFKLIKIDKVAEDSGLMNLLKKGKVEKTISELLGIAVYWLVMLVVIFVAINFAGIKIPSTVIDSLLGFIPKFILGLLIFIFSLFVGNLFGGIVRTSAANAGIEKSGLLGKLTQGSIVIFGAVVGLQQIGIAPTFIGNVFIIVLASFCFGLALAFALGTKDIIKQYVEEFLKKYREEKE